MSRTQPWPVGTPCWIDLMVPDVVAAGEFYAAVLGWQVAAPDEQYGGYVIAESAGAPVAGIGPMMPGARTAWTLYFATADADAAASAITGAGGTLLRPPGDVGPLGRMLVAADPSGAVFGAWQAGTFPGTGMRGEPGALVWEDLRSSDPDAARACYATVFGHVSTPMPEAGPTYQTFTVPGAEGPLGGTGDLSDLPDGVPSHWQIYLGVPDTDAALAEATRRGARTLVPPFDTPFGRMAAVTDPFEAFFWLAGPPPAH